MSVSNDLRDLYDRLKEDSLRKNDLPFSDDVTTVNEVLFNPYAKDSEREKALSGWFHKRQSCLFGSIAATSGHLHYCLLSERDIIGKSDGQIAAHIQQQLQAWKRRSLRPNRTTPAYGFVLLAYSPRLAKAAPDQNLFEFSRKLRDLWGCEGTEEGSGTMHWETLYLRHPKDEAYLKFTFSIDFFLAQGDGRWWHDHRTPGGVMFTANSVGYMRKYLEWYKKKEDHEEWTIETAMLTIAKASERPFGKATWLRKLENGLPMVDYPCPFADRSKLKDVLKDADWTRYSGYLHTDHSIRPAFFDEGVDPAPELITEEFLQDFTYLYDPNNIDYARFVRGEDALESEVTTALGPISSWQTLYTRLPRAKRVQQVVGALTRPAELWSFGKSEEQFREEQKVMALLSEIEGWRMLGENP
jgi:hypothetical protein